MFNAGGSLGTGLGAGWLLALRWLEALRRGGMTLLGGSGVFEGAIKQLAKGPVKIGRSILSVEGIRGAVFTLERGMAVDQGRRCSLRGLNGLQVPDQIAH